MFRIALACISILWAGGAAAQSCSEIRFSPGASSGTVSGKVTDAQPMCFVFGTGAGQTAQLMLTGSNNACFTIPGVIDCQTSFSFATQARTYEVGVYQLLRTTGAEQFTLRLTIN